MRRSFYTVPVDHHSLTEWPRLADRLRRAASTCCRQDVDVEIGDAPVFTYGTDLEETLLTLEDLSLPPRAVHIDLWSAIVYYGVICVSLGDGIVRKERRALDKNLGKALAGQPPLRQTEGTFDRHSGRIYGYRLDPDDDRDRVTFSHLVSVFDPPCYVGERWLLQDEDESVDGEKFLVAKTTCGPIVQFLALDPAAEERAWRHAMRGDGLIALFNDDPDRDEITRSFARKDDLRCLFGKRSNYRVTLGRGRPEDSLMVTYDASVAPEEAAQLLFVV